MRKIFKNEHAFSTMTFVRKWEETNDEFYYLFAELLKAIMYEV
jgi:hypothetical protein